jgi:hypothetical protein
MFLSEMLAIKDKAGESSSGKTILIPNAAAMLLLELIDMDEEKHDGLVGKRLKVITHHQNNQKVSG